MRALLAEPDLEVQVGGGVRDLAAIEAWLEAGARRVILGTRAIEAPDFLAEAAERFPDRVILAADVRGRRVATRGWEHVTEIDVLDLVATLAELRLAGLLVTGIYREGRLQGTDLDLMRVLAARTRVPLYASGGITLMDELRALAGFGVHAAILGMALYSGTLDPAPLAREFAS
jgi:phosphoribosylformimino-5-aminoimidazole carboxamide ribotide isomerase